MTSSKFVQVLRVEDFRIESGVEAVPTGRGSATVRNFVRIWLMGSPAIAHSRVTNAFLEARSDWGEPSVPSFDFSGNRILIGYAMGGIEAVVAMLGGGLEVHCQYREFEGGGVYAGVYRAQGGGEQHWVPAG